jgi:hypothetical protein
MEILWILGYLRLTWRQRADDAHKAGPVSIERCTNKLF